MFRIKIALVVLGGILAFFGIQEWRVSRGTTPEPIAVNLVDVETSTAPTNSHWKLGDHIAIYNAGVYRYSKSKYSSDEPGFDTKIDYYYYPVLSTEHPYLVQLKTLADQFGSVEAIPAEQIPTLTNFTVLVKTKRFETLGVIPGEWGVESSLEGLVVNQIASLGGDEEKLFHESFPGLDMEKMLLLEADRRPASAAKSFGMIGGGCLVSLAGVGWLIAGRSQA